MNTSRDVPCGAHSTALNACLCNETYDLWWEGSEDLLTRCNTLNNNMHHGFIRSGGRCVQHGASMLTSMV